MSRIFPAKSSIRSKFQYFAIWQKSEEKKSFILHNNKAEKILTTW